MSVFISSKDYENENRRYKRSSLVSKKVKLPTDMKSKKCSISKCPYPAVVMGKIGNEKRSLCKPHYDQYVNKDEKHLPIFVKATGLL